MRMSLQLLRNLHTNQPPHMIFNHLAKVIEQSMRNPIFQEYRKSVHYRNSFKALNI